MSMKMRKCTLCDTPARVYCESDDARLCWDCDAKVHEANFLVARHCRTLLCRSCSSLTVWKASGPRLGSTVSICDRCSRGVKVEDVHHDEGEGESLREEVSDQEDVAPENGEEEHGENQVVPWGMERTTVVMTPPVASCSSSGTDHSDSSTSTGTGKRDGDATRNAFAKRRREYLDLNASPQVDFSDC